MTRSIKRKLAFFSGILISGITFAIHPDHNLIQQCQLEADYHFEGIYRNTVHQINANYANAVIALDQRRSDALA